MFMCTIVRSVNIALTRPSSYAVRVPWPGTSACSRTCTDPCARVHLCLSAEAPHIPSRCSGRFVICCTWRRWLALSTHTHTHTHTCLRRAPCALALHLRGRPRVIIHAWMADCHLGNPPLAVPERGTKMRSMQTAAHWTRLLSPDAHLMLVQASCSHPVKPHALQSPSCTTPLDPLALKEQFDMCSKRAESAWWPEHGGAACATLSLGLGSMAGTRAQLTHTQLRAPARAAPCPWSNYLVRHRSEAVLQACSRGGGSSAAPHAARATPRAHACACRHKQPHLFSAWQPWEAAEVGFDGTRGAPAELLHACELPVDPAGEAGRSHSKRPVDPAAVSCQGTQQQ